MYLEGPCSPSALPHLAALDAAERLARTPGFSYALVRIAEGIALTFTTLVLITMSESLLLVGAQHRLQQAARAGHGAVARPGGRHQPCCWPGFANPHPDLAGLR